MRGLLLSAALLAAAGAPKAQADINLWIDDVAGNIGLVDVTTQSVVPGSVHSTGQALTDIAFIGNQMYGTTFGVRARQRRQHHLRRRWYGGVHAQYRDRTSWPWLAKTRPR
jgi:hypothetical protein